MRDRVTAADVARMIADACSRAGMSYAIGGAIALGFYAPPRATVDVDVNAFVELDDLDRVVSTLGDAGFILEQPLDRARVLETGAFRGYVTDVRVDVFVPAVPYYGELEARRREVVLLGRPLWIVGPEDLAVLKMMFFRRKDLADVEALLRDQSEKLDHAFVRDRLVAFVGEDDARVRTFEEIRRGFEDT